MSKRKAIFLVFFGAVIIFLVVLGLKVHQYLSPTNIQSSAGRVNILILGIGGKGHAGADLTDTMIVASVSLTKPSLVFVSLPRDIWIPTIRAKINSAYYWGGFDLARTTTQGVVGLPLNYAMVMDFSGFTKIIDVLGGVTVNVERSFTDENYPIAGLENDPCGGDPLFRCRYKTVSFTQGLAHMDGETALEFARSRYAKGAEGTDLARAARQEKIIQAVKNKLLSKDFFLYPKKVLAVWQAVKDSIQTDLGTNALMILAERALIGRNNIVQVTMPQEMLINPPISKTYDQQYVFVPASGTWDQVHAWVNSLIN
jgi:anionic cell wall polymer biosynthesis LytR-Cps2A-Psr (LCP) family protein